MAILFGIVDFGMVLLAKQNLALCTREGARMAIAARPVTTAEVETRIDECLNEGNASADVTVTITPDVTTSESGDAIVVTASRDYAFSLFPMTLDLQSSSRMVKE